MNSTEGFSNDIGETKGDKFRHEGGKFMANPPLGEEVVISGIAGVFPNTNNICELGEKLFDKVDLVQANDRWDNNPDLPARFGVIPEINKYDGGFFGVHERQSHSLAAIARIFQEKVLEAVFDAGLHPSELEGTKTGVYVGVCYSENDRAWYTDNLRPQTFAVTGSERSMIAHRISYFLKLKGPSMGLDSACSSSGYALENAYAAIRSGEIDNAIVGGTQLCLNPGVAMQFLRLGALNKTGCCKTFDVEADGYARAESVVAVVLQKAKHSKRIYARIVHAKTNADGFKEKGIMFPSKDSQMELLNDFYEECGVDKCTLSFVEAHGTGTQAGDVQECGSLDGFFARGRCTPLLIGSVKSNVGHTEAASCLSSLVKCILAMETGYIPPNIHFNTPNDAVRGLMEGRLKVVVDKTPLKEGNELIGINSFGLGGANAHVLLKRTSKRKVDFEKDLSRLVCVSGRTEEAVDILLEQIEANAKDVEYIKLLHEVFAKGIQNHLYRGFTVVSRFGTIVKSFAFCPQQQDKYLYVVFGELANWQEIGIQLMTLPVFRDFILEIQEHLTGKSVNISDAFLNDGLFDRSRVPVLGSVAVQMAVVQLLESVDVKANGCFGYSLGELASAYYDKRLTLEETIRCAVLVNETVLNNKGLEKVSTAKENPITCENCKAYCGNALKDEILQKIEAPTRNGCCSMNDIRANSILLKIGDAVLDETEEASVISLFGNGNKDYLVEFLAELGRLHLSGNDLQINRLYPGVDLPVGRGTPMISPYIRWNHSREKFVPQYHVDLIRQSKRGIKRYNIDVADQQWAFIAGHVIDGKNLFPATGYLYMVWETFSSMQGIALNSSRVSLKNCRFLRTTSVPFKGSLVFTVSILTSTGEFEVIEGNAVVITGTVGLLPDNEVNVRSLRSTPDLMESRSVCMDKKDVYKEMRLRGYQYGEEFQGIENYNPLTCTAYLNWTGNWMTFLDNMLQLMVLQTDNRALKVPTFIFRIDIATDAHLDLIEEIFIDEEVTTRNLPTCSDRKTGNIKCGGVTISQMHVSPIVRKKNLEIPLLESYEFVQNFTELDLHTSVSINTQIILENTLARKFKAVEVIDEFSDDDIEPLTPIIELHLLHKELVGQPAVKILTPRSFDVVVNVENKKLENETDCLLVVVSKAVNRPEVLKSAFAVLKENGFVISRESPHWEGISDLHPHVMIVTAHRTPFETILLLRRRSQQREARYIEINSSEDFSWLPQVQEALNINQKEDLVLYSVDPTSGILGMMRCLRHESGNGNIRCIFFMNGDEKFDPTSNVCRDQLEKGLAFNVYKNGQWGTFRYLPLEDSIMVESEHCFADLASRGDLSSLRWVEGALTHRTTAEPGKELIYVYYSAINFRDIMIATGKISADSDRLEEEVFLGLEFSGRDRRGKRVMGSCLKGAHANLILADSDLVYGVPDGWTMEEAATVPIVYTTAIYALIECGQMRRGESVLIHSGAGGVGQAAINLALHYGCEVFTTVGSGEKRDFLKKTYPQLKDENIGNSRDESFEHMVLGRTNGKGIDLVLNSLAGEKLIASVKCLAVGGRFLEIGKFDVTNNLHLSMMLLEKQASFHGIMIDNIFVDYARCGIRKTFERLVWEGAVRPLNRSVFKCGEVEQAFRFMATGRHTGKVLIQLRQPEEQLVILPPTQILHSLARYYCDPQMVYVIVGGLGGFGLELVHWLVLRGATKLVLASRKGISTGYQQYRIRIEGCERLIKEALRLGRIAAVFNLAITLNDAVFENQTQKSFLDAFEPKGLIIRHLDDVTRTMCPALRDFVVFSSFVPGRGHVGQTNYGMANSAMERLCERRRRDGYPALAIQWGLVGEVGVVAEVLKAKIEGLSRQAISSCLQVLDTLLRQRDAVVVSSVVVVQKKESQSSENIVDTILNVIGVKNSKYVSLHSTLPELGMDSMLAIEIKVTLERDFDIFLSMKELRKVTLARLKEIREEKIGARGDASTKHDENFKIERFFRLSKEDLCNKLSRIVPEFDEDSTPPRVVLFPGMEGFAGVLQSVSGHLTDARTVQYVPDGQSTSVAAIVESLFPTIQKLLPKGKTFFFVAYSYGALVALEMVHALESQGYMGTLICVDGAPLVVKRMVNSLNAQSDEMLLTSLIYQLLSFFVPHDEFVQNKINVSEYQTWEEKVNFAAELVKNYDANSAYYVEKVAGAIYRRREDLDTYQPTYEHLRSDIKLFKPTSLFVRDIQNDYGLSDIFQRPVEIQYFEGNHETILENEKLAEAINLVIQKLA